MVLNHDLQHEHGGMTLITFQDGKVVMSGGNVGTEAACCCGGSSQSVACCGVPKNCDVTAYVGVNATYDQATNSWRNGNNSVPISFGDCRYLLGNTPDVGDEYASCCISFQNSGTPGVANPADPCTLISAWIVGRIVCDSCCDAEPEYAGDQNEYGVNCRIEGVIKGFFEIGDCSAQKAALDYDNWDITMTCDPSPDPCNPLP